MPTTEKKPTPVSFVSPKHNHILEALPAQDYARLLPDLQPVSMPLGLVLCESGAHMHYIYFPTTSIVSLTYVMKNGATGEIAVTGNEGLVGISLFMGDDRSPNQAVVQSAGEGYRLHASIVKQEFTLGGKLHYLALRFTQSLIAQMSQTAVCNRHHTVDQQLCRLLLLSLDRLSTNELVMTQELIANMLGVRREGVTEAASKLQQDGMITYKRGHIAVVDRPKLEKRVCECYAVVKNEYDRLLSCPPPVTLTAFPGLWANTRKRFRLELKVRLSISSLLNYAFYCTGSEPVKQDWFARKNGHPDRMPKGSEYERLDRENVLNHFQSYFNA